MFEDAVDILENDLQRNAPELLRALLRDRTTGKNIIWATSAYEKKGKGFCFHDSISVKSITGRNGHVVQPRVSKSEDEQKDRVREKGEVFTPVWLCNRQNNLVDDIWFGVSGIFNTETDRGWITKDRKIPFPTKKGRDWKDYVRDTRLEIACGEAPYLVTRYDTTTGEPIPVKDRIGILDRKLRVVSENTRLRRDWYWWAKEAFKSSFGYEWQGDNLLLARENLLYTYCDHFEAKFGAHPAKKELMAIANVISWNIWQMDGLKGVIPDTCHSERKVERQLFEEIITEVQCQGCEKGDNHAHNGTYCYIWDWAAHKTVRFIDLTTNNDYENN